MLLLVMIYGLSTASAGLLVLALFPELQGRLLRYVRVQSQQSQDQLEEMFIDIPQARLQLFYFGLPVTAGLVLWLATGSIWLLPAGLLAGFIMPRWVMGIIRSQRQAKFRRQLVDALMVLSSSLKAGLSLLQSMEVVVEESMAPMSQELGLVVKETRMGLSLDEALKRLKERMPVEELNLVITTILVARETGGDVTTVFGNLVETIRERFKMQERVKTLTVIPRLQGWIMAAMPFVFGVTVTKSSQDYFKIMWTDPTGNMFAALAAGLWVISIIMIIWFSRPPR